MDTRGLAIGVLDGFILIQSNKQNQMGEKINEEVIGEGNRILVDIGKIVALK